MVPAENNTSGPVPQCSKDNSEFKTNSNERDKLPKLVPKVVPVKQTRQQHHKKVGITIPPSDSNAEDNRVKEEASTQLKQKPVQYICCQNHKVIAGIENDIMDPVMQCTTLPSHSGFSQQKLVSFVTEIHTLSIDISLRDR
ncbi:hypothetical protein Tco_0939407 [Tanacetum coccineum]|uniref:Uncharacterized protein n=1 Tax=Tanacetum coccineum TaxID=301880 RepID=A0ABQ5DMD1_9ASTR